MAASLGKMPTTIKGQKAFDPISEGDAVRRPRRGAALDVAVEAFDLGELIRDVFDILRTASEPMSVADLAAGLMRRKATPNDRGAREFVESRVDKALRRKEGDLVERVVLGPRAVTWRIKPPAANTRTS
jgi:hypothetical protein